MKIRKSIGRLARLPVLADYGALSSYLEPWELKDLSRTRLYEGSSIIIYQ